MNSEELLSQKLESLSLELDKAKKNRDDRVLLLLAEMAISTLENPTESERLSDFEKDWLISFLDNIPVLYVNAIRNGKKSGDI